MTKHKITVDEMGHFEVEDDGRLYWRGQAVILERKISLEGWTLVWVAVGAIGAVLAGAWPIVDYLWLP